MNRLTLCLLCAGLAAPALAQDLNPAIESSGSQTQSVELLGGSVSVSVESSGSLSINRGNDSLDGALGVSVNDAPIVGVSSPNNDATTPGAGAPASPGSATRPATSARPAVLPQGSAMTVQAASEVECNAPSNTDGLSQALAQDVPIMVRAVACATTANQFAQLISSYPTLDTALSGAGIASNRVVAITIANDAVIVDYTP